MDSADPANRVPPDLPPASPPPVLETAPANRTVAGFWRRVGAFLVDAVFLGVIGSILGWAMFDMFAAWGLWARLVGFFIAGAYFTFGNSSAGRGQTLGKRLLEIAVVDRSGGHISPARALLRFLILGVPFFLNGVTVANMFGGVILGLLTAVLGFSLVYLLVCNRRTRRSAHDLLTGTWVVRAREPGTVPLFPVWRGHWVVLTLVAIAAISGGAALGAFGGKATFFTDMIALRQKLLATDKLTNAGVFAGRTVRWVNSVRTDTYYLTVTVRPKRRPVSYDAVIREYARIVLANYRDTGDLDAIGVNVLYGYDIGIAQGTITRTETHTPKEWRQRLGAE